MSETMQAIGAVGAVAVDDPGAFVMVAAPVPELGPRDLLVRVQAVSVNPVDTKQRASMDAGDPPRILGFDAAGTVEAVGDEVTGFRAGDEVWYAGDVTRDGSDAELQAVDERVVARRPSSVSFAAAASLPLTAITASEALHDHLTIPGGGAGRTLLVLGGAGGVGSILIQLARQEFPQLRVIATASRPESRDWVQSLGAHAVIDHHELVQQGRDAAPDGVDYLFSAHSQGQEEAFAELLNPLGHIVAIDDPESIDLMALKPRALTWHWEFMFARPMWQTPDLGRQGEHLRRVAELVDAGSIRTTETETIADFSPDGVRRAHQLVESGRMVGKVVVTR
jgi:NADPH:quinone reductase